MTSENTRFDRSLSIGAFVAGLTIVAWMARGFWHADPLALGMTLLIGAVYLLGAWEVRRFEKTTTGFLAALNRLSQPVAQLDDWLPSVPAPLRNATQQYIESQRSAFPGLALTPYLVGLLVMLGMLGTFLGMVVTFQGAVFALEGSSDLNAVRSALAAPIKGLGLSFGTSVAGVAASAMLGLMATLARRHRAQAMRRLDALVATHLRGFSAAHQRQLGFEAMQLQAQAMPAAVQHLHALVAQLERRNQQLDDALLARHSEFQQQAAAAYTGLAQSVERSLRQSLDDGARAAQGILQPAVQQAMEGLAAQSSRLHQEVGSQVQHQLGQLSAQFGASATAVVDAWNQSLQQHEHRAQQLLDSLSQTLSRVHTGLEQGTARLLDQVRSEQSQALVERHQAEQQQHAAWASALERTGNRLSTEWRLVAEQTAQQQQAVWQAMERTAQGIAQAASEQTTRNLESVAHLIAKTEALVQARADTESTWVAQHGQRMDQLAQLWRSELAALRSDEAERGAAAVQRLGELQAALSTQLASLGQALEEPMVRWMHTASEAPKAAAEVIAQLREQVGRATERDNAALAERADLVHQIAGLLQQVQHTTGQQHAAIEQLVGSATRTLDQVGQQFADAMALQTGRAQAMVEQTARSANQLAQLGETFQQGAQQLAVSHEQLVHSLQKVEGAIGESLARSDEQLAYYVAQAREVIDLSISAQQGVVEDLRRLREPLKAAMGAQA